MSAASHTEDLGKLSLTAKTLQFRSAFYQSWDLPVEELRLLGEYTNEDGPHAADHFLVFFGLGGRCFEAPVDADGVVAVLRELESVYSHPVQPELRFNTTFASRAIWPPQLSGQELFTVREKADRLADRIKSAIGFGKVELSLRPEIARHVGGHED
jgi:hypothetical protein